MKKGLLYITFFHIISSCAFFQKEIDQTVIARVGENYLYQDDINEVWNDKLSQEDSIIIVNNFINTWAKKHLLIEKAKINLDEEKISKFENLIEEYRKDLYMAAYKEALVNREMDSMIPYDEMIHYYEENKDNFKLNEDLIKLRYIQIDNSFSDIELIKEKLTRFNKEDQEELEAIGLQFKSYSLNDSSWVKVREFTHKIPLINADNKNRYLKKSQFFELTDSLEVYLVHVKDILKKNDNAPLEYITPTLQQIILNKRKLEFIRNLEKDLIDEAIQKKRFEIYEKN